MGTANTLQCLTEALGLSLPGTATIPAYHADKLRAARAAGRRIVAMVDEDLTARKILTRDALHNAVMTDLAIGGSTNATLHLPAIAHALGFELPLATFNEYNKRIPTLVGVSPNGPHGVPDLHRAGGIPAVMKMLGDDLHLEALCASGEPFRKVVARAAVLDPTVIHPKSAPHNAEGGTVVLFGNLAPDGAVVKQSAVAPDMLAYAGPARVFNAEADCLTAIREGKLVEGEIIVIRYEGPRGGPGMPEMLAVTMALDLMGMKRTALVTDGRFSGATAGPCVGHVSPEAYSGGPLAAVRDGDRIAIDVPNRRLSLELSESEISARLAGFTPVEHEVPPGYLRRYRRHVRSAALGAVLD
jgi:dihydroxy-acid dehydratase